MWRKHQTRAVNVINLISENTIEHRMLDTLAAKQGLADGVLDSKGDLSKISMRGGAQAFFKRLSQIIEIQKKQPEAPGSSEATPVDRTAFWAKQAHELLKGNLVICEERYPLEGPQTVLIAVVERDAEAWRPRLQHLHDGLFGPGKCDPLAPVCFDVIDRATHEALKRLEDAGLVTKTVRATRPLYPETTGETKLADEKKAEMGKIIEQIARKVRWARLLVSGDLGEEAQAPSSRPSRSPGAAWP